MIKDIIYDGDFLNDYFAILFLPNSWFIIIIWHLLLGAVVLFLFQKCVVKDFKFSKYISSVGTFIGFGFLFEMIKGINYLYLNILFFLYEYYWNKPKILSVDIHKVIYHLWDSGFNITEIIFMIYSLFITIAFCSLIYGFILGNYKTTKRNRIIISTILSIFSGAYYLLYL